MPPAKKNNATSILPHRQKKKTQLHYLNGQTAKFKKRFFKFLRMSEQKK